MTFAGTAQAILHCGASPVFVEVDAATRCLDPTAAADAVAASVLARPDSETLALFGAGNQGLFECAAVARILPIDRVLVVARDASKVEGFAERLPMLFAFAGIPRPLWQDTDFSVLT